MNPASLLLWLSLFGVESNAPGAAAVVERPPVHEARVWVGSWVVGERREAIVAEFAPVAGRGELSGELRFGEGAAAVTEHWVGRIENGRLRLNHAGLGEARLTATPDGRLVGRLSRHAATGSIELVRHRDEARGPTSP
jgi:hypothetical protein